MVQQIKDLKTYEDGLKSLTIAEKSRQALLENFKKETDAFKNADVKGLLSIKEGVLTLATTEQEVQKNRIDRLRQAIKLGKDDRALRDDILKKIKNRIELSPEEETTYSRVTQSIEASEDATMATVGAFILAVQEVKKLNDELDKILLNLQSQIKLQQLQNNLAVQQAKYAVADAKAKTAIIKLQGGVAAAQGRLKILQAEKSANEAILSNQEKQVEIAKILRDAENDRLDSAYAYMRAQTEVANAQRLQTAQNTQNQQQRFSGLFSEQDKRNTAKEIAKIEYENAVIIIRMQETEREDKYKREAAAIVVERNLLMEGTVARAAIAAQEIQIIDQQIAVAHANSAVAKAQAQNNLDNLENNKTLAYLQYDIQEEQINANRTKAILDLEQYKRQIDYLNTLSAVYNSIDINNKDHVENLKKIYEARNPGKTIEDLTLNKNSFIETDKAIKKADDKVKELFTSTNKLFDNQLINNFNLANLAREKLNEDIKGAKAALANTGIANDAEIKALIISKGLKEEVAELTEKEIQAKISALNTSLVTLQDKNDTASIATKAQIAAERNVYEQRLKDIQALENAYAKFASRSLDIVENKLMAGVDSFFDAVQNGTLTLQNFKEGVVQVFQDILFDIAKESFKEDLIQPLIGGVRKYIGGLIPGVGKDDDESKEGGGGSTAASLFGSFTADTASVGEQTANKTAKDGAGIFAIFGELLTPVFEGLRSFADTIGLTDIVTSIFGSTAEGTTGSVAGLGLDAFTAAIKTGVKTAADTSATTVVVSFTTAVISATAALITMAASAGAGGGAGGIAKESFKEDLIQPLIGGVRKYIGGLIPGVGKDDDESKEGGGGSTAASLFGSFTADTASVGEQTANKTAKDGAGIFAIFGELLTPVFEGLRSFADTIGLTDIVTSIFGSTAEGTTGSVAGLGLDAFTAAIKTGVKTAADTSATTVVVSFTTAVISATAALITMAASAGAGGGAGSIFGLVAKVGGAAFGFAGAASGGRMPTGLKHLAAGGSALRDRVPAMLEPGEFVLRKHAVDTMGFNAASQLNATGNAGIKNIKVQIENSGKPKEASESETLFDAEKAIIKVVLKDYKSNGPIRRTIRGDN